MSTSAALLLGLPAAAAAESAEPLASSPPVEAVAAEAESAVSTTVPSADPAATSDPGGSSSLDSPPAASPPSTPSNGPSASSHPTSTASSGEAAPERADPAASVQSAVSSSIRSASEQAATIVDRAAETVSEPDSATVPSDLPLQSRDLPLQREVGRTLPPNRHPLQLARETLQRGAEALRAPGNLESLLQSAAALLTIASETSSPSLSGPSALPPGVLLPRTLPDIGDRSMGFGVLDSQRTQYQVGFSGKEPLRVLVPSVGAGLGADVLSPAHLPVGAAGGSAGGSSEDLAPSKGNEPTPLPARGSPATAASGSGSSSFIPVVALLALLALATPATARRLREAPVFRPPNPFVCALERPG